QLLKSRQEYFFYNLQITEVTRRQIVHYHHNLFGENLYLVTLSPCQFEHIGILLMGHNTGTSCTLVRKFHEANILTTKHTSIKRHLTNGSGNRSQGKSYITFHFATSHLRIYHIIVHRIKTQQTSSHLTV